jgi:hypothetical protein
MNDHDRLPPPPRWYNHPPLSPPAPATDPPGPAAPSHDSAEPDQVPAREIPGPDVGIDDAQRPATPAGDENLSLAQAWQLTRSAFVSPDLLRPGPGVPFGRRARARKARRRDIADETQRRRRALVQAIEHSLRPPRPDRRAWRTVDPRANRLVILTLCSVVGLVGALAVSRHHGPDTAPRQETLTSSVPGSTAAPNPVLTSLRPTMSARAVPPRPPIPSGGVTPLTADTPQKLDPTSVVLTDPPLLPPTPTDLATAESAAAAWMARWCAFTYTDAVGTNIGRARPAMTPAGWAGFASSTPSRASWAATVAAGESARCSTPTARISPEAPRSADSAIVLVTADRVVSAAHATPYVESLGESRVIRRGDDGLWRVDTATEGG